ncbi:MAG: single-stranded-DNA-specific exonuclease RecJ [[Eubacterium] saphenum]|nr:single-stranded-DNA-specific exonuclease RecJ [[Eubacterium] saphenum]
MRKWIVPAAEFADEEICAEYGNFLGKILSARGIHTKKAAEKLFGDGEFMEEPLPADIEKAVEVITESLENGDKITVFGDYDCDGVTSTVMMYSYLDSLGAEVDYYIPDRSEGFGMNIPALQKIISGGTQLIITVDNGVNALEEAEFIKSHGVKLVIADHHQPGETLPVCDACVNPNRADDYSQFKDLCGAGVVLKLLCALEEDKDYILENYADLAMVGTIGDVMPLRGENRLIVKKGLEALKHAGNEGLKKLVYSAGLSPKNLTASDISFKICPAINSAGRVEKADKAVRLLLAKGEGETARLCENIVQLNAKRREIEQKITDDIQKQIANDPSILTKRVIFLAGEGWKAGVIGIVCSKIVEKYGKPTIVVAIENGEGRGSCRSVGNFSIYGLLNHCSAYLKKFGGHPLAGGFSVKADEIGEFKQKIEEYAAAHYPKMPEAELYADLRVTGNMLTVGNIESLNRLEPLGEGFAKPVFLLENCEIKEKRPLKDGKYISLDVKNGNSAFRAVSFKISYSDFAAEIGDSIDIIVHAEINEYNDNKSVQLKLLDYRPTGFREDRFFAAKRVSDAILRGEDFDKRLLPRIVPQSREDLMKIYDLLRKNNGRLTLEQLAVFNGSVNYCMLKIAVTAFCEANLAQFDGERARLVPAKEKRDLFKEGILARLAESGT